MSSVSINTYFAFGTHGALSTPTNRSSNFEDLKMPREMQAVETTTFNSGGNRSYEIGLHGATFSGSGVWDTTIDGHIEALITNREKVSFEYGPNGNTSTYTKYSGTMFFTKYDLGTKVGDKIPFTFECQIDGAVTKGTFS